MEPPGWAVALLSTFLLDHFELFGLRQGFHAARLAGLRTPWLYRWVRHPLYLGMLIGLWVTPTMTGGHLLLAAAMTAFMGWPCWLPPAYSQMRPALLRTP
jgi:protein-S-isoprenylcysteine O-methyltransferase Ste14